MDFFTAEEMHEQAEESNNIGNEAATSERDVFNPVLNSVSEVTEK